MRTGLIVGLIIVYVALGIVDLRNHNITTGISAFLLAAVNGLLFFAGGKT
uniref:Uncharacterized protein n=1 Tax=viral metagenome TaxID=1070528 RepID=A0A6M3KE24_9ZZZZ